MTFFITGSKVTKIKSEEKRKFEKNFKEGRFACVKWLELKFIFIFLNLTISIGGERNWIQVICNGGMATFLAILYLLDYGSGESAINFSTNYRASWLSIGVLGFKYF